MNSHIEFPATSSIKVSYKLLRYYENKYRYRTLQRSSRLYTMRTCLSSFFSSDNTLNSNHDFLIKSIIIYVLSFSGQAKLVSFISQLDAQNIAAKMTMRTVVTTHRLKQELWQKCRTKVPRQALVCRDPLLLTLFELQGQNLVTWCQMWCSNLQTSRGGSHQVGDSNLCSALLS